MQQWNNINRSQVTHVIITDEWEHYIIIPPKFR